ncbi:MAG: dihydroneopterin aldolase [Bacteroidales bacterium]|nr:dihydroneopterin aldolase [Bacteroidales bacterium]
MKNQKLELKGMKFYAFHGCLPFERQSGAEYLVDFECYYDFGPAAGCDDLSQAIDLARVYALVAAQMQIPCKLIETVAVRIADSISAEFPQLERFSVKVCKLNPPVDGECLLSAATVERP